MQAYHATRHCLLGCLVCAPSHPVPSSPLTIQANSDEYYEKQQNCKEQKSRCKWPGRDHQAPRECIRKVMRAIDQSAKVICRPYNCTGRAEKLKQINVATKQPVCTMESQLRGGKCKQTGQQKRLFCLGRHLWFQLDFSTPSPNHICKKRERERETILLPHIHTGKAREKGTVCADSYDGRQIEM